MKLIAQRQLFRTRNAAIVATLLFFANEAGALWGFGGGGSASQESAARAQVIEEIRARAAADEFSPPAAGVGRQDAARYVAAQAAGELSCGDFAVVKWEMVNDEFCDCEDGSDEPGTSACAKGVFECANRGHLPLRLPSSRVGDGICDCCDGSDEVEGVCGVSCEKASEAWVEQLADKVVKAEQGTVRREEYVRQAAEAANERTLLLEETTSTVEEARRELETAKEELKTLETQEKTERTNKLLQAEDAVRSRVGSGVSPERVTALGVAVASAQDSSATLDKVSSAVLQGVDVGEVLRDLLDDGKGNNDEDVHDHDEHDTVARRRGRGKGKGKGVNENPASRHEGGEEEGVFFTEDEDEYGHEEVEPSEGHDDDHFDYADLDDMEHYAGMHMNDDDYFIDFDDEDFGDYGEEGRTLFRGETDQHSGVIEDEQKATTIDEDVAGTGRGGHEGRAESGDIPVPALDSESAVVTDVAAEAGVGSEAEKGVEQEEEEVRFKPPKEFQTLKHETPEAVAGRKRVKDLQNKLKSDEKKLKTLEDEASTDYGTDGVLWALKDKCITHKTGGYDYRVCPFKDAYQDESKSKKTLIGKWKGIEQADLLSSTGATAEAENHILNGQVLVFDKGQKCWNGPHRSLRVALACGAEDLLSTVAEPETCTYTAILETPAACKPGLRDILLDGAGGRGDAVKGDESGEYGGVCENDGSAGDVVGACRRGTA